MGKSEDFAHKGACGMVNIIPFTCMPGNIVESLLKRFRERHDNMPVLNIACDGQEDTNTLARMEAFMYQVHQDRPRQRQKGALDAT